MSMIPKKAVELTGEALNYAVAVSQGHAVSIEPAQLGVPSRVFIEVGMQKIRYRPERDGDQLIQLITKYQIAIIPEAHDGLEGTEMSSRWYGNVYFNGGEEYTTPAFDSLSTAVCMGVVGVEFGDFGEIDIPAVLLTEQEHSK